MLGGTEENSVSLTRGLTCSKLKKIELVARTAAATSRRRKRGYYNNGMEVHFIFLAQTVKKPC